MPVLRLSNSFRREVVVLQTVLLRYPELEKILKTKLKTATHGFDFIKGPSFRLRGRITLLSVILAFSAVAEGVRNLVVLSNISAPCVTLRTKLSPSRTLWRVPDDRLHTGFPVLRPYDVTLRYRARALPDVYCARCMTEEHVVVQW